MKDYYLGLDMGTSSVGWAVTDDSYNILRAKGKDLWGIREFEQANPAADRRMKRTSRRRRQREQVRAALIRTYFDDAIKAVDPNFFIRLDNSKYHKEDKDACVYDSTTKKQNAIFNDANYKDSDYYKEYPTIFHLRKALLENEDIAYDVRLVYLAISNMFKHRGHFLNSGLSGKDNDIPEMFEAYNIFMESLNRLNDNDIEFDEVDSVVFPQINDVNLVEAILSNRSFSRTDKSVELAKLFSITKKQKRSYEFIKLMSGLKTDARILFPALSLEEKLDICFSDIAYEENSTEIQSKLGDLYFEVVSNVKNIYDIGILSGILKGSRYLSCARVESYEKHKKDLAILKNTIKEFCSQEDYDDMFRNESVISYSAYVRSFNSDYSNQPERRKVCGLKREDLYKKINSLLKNADIENPNVKYIQNEIKIDNFLPKQLTSENGIIPNQVHKRELTKILDNASKYLTFLNDKDESGYTVAERILMLFSFQIPYYIGPTSENSQKNKGNGWVVRKQGGMVLPWNINEKIDVNKTSELFIERLIRDCTYLSGEKVLPKESMLYQKYCVLNEINNIKIDGERIDEFLKQDIYNDLFKKGKKVTRKALFKYLYNRGLIEDDSQLSGIDININNALTTYGKFYSLWGDKIEEDTYKKAIEEIVRLCVIFGDSKEILKNKLKDTYSDIVTDDNIKRIIGFKFKDWGRLSKELLLLEGNDETGETISLIDALWTTNYNLMELINDERFMFKSNLEAKKQKQTMTLSDFTAEDLNDYYFSAPVKRMIWQTLLIIKEIQHVMGKAPKRIFIEMTRSEEEKGDKGRTKSRKNQLLDLYKNIKDEVTNWTDLINKEDVSGRLKSKKMYLYITQMGKCMYTGNTIDLDKLFDDSVYDIDHIYPQSLIKDDNLNNNLVLVERRSNIDKSDVYPLSSNIRSNSKVTNHWKFLREKELITKEKYNRLTGNKAFTDEQKAGFIARQLVETSQGTKGVADLLKLLLPKETTIVYAKASNVSDFRRDNGFVKSRLVNEFHHAQDAYLNIVVGNVYYVKFTHNPLNFIKNDYYRDSKAYRYNLSKMFRWDVVRGNEIAWIAGNKEGKTPTIETVKKMMSKNTPLMTRLSLEGKGAIANETLYSASKAKPKAYIPFKASDDKLSDVTKYGGFTSVSTAYFFLVEHEQKGKKVRTLETVPVYMRDKIESNPTALEEYCINDLELINPSVRLRKIKLQSLIKRNGYYLHISGKTNNRITVRNAINMCLPIDKISYIHDIENSIANGYLKSTINKEYNIEIFELLIYKHKNTIFSKRPNPIYQKLENVRDKFYNLGIKDQCIVIKEILNLSFIGCFAANFKLLDMAENSGVMLISKKISASDENLLINQSVTGIYEEIIDLLTV